MAWACPDIGAYNGVVKNPWCTGGCTFKPEKKVMILLSAGCHVFGVGDPESSSTASCNDTLYERKADAKTKSLDDSFGSLNRNESSLSLGVPIDDSHMIV